MMTIMMYIKIKVKGKLLTDSFITSSKAKNNNLCKILFLNTNGVNTINIRLDVFKCFLV